MIVRKLDYKIDEVAFLLDVPARAVLALCDAGVIACSRLVSNGALKQRKRRHVSHDEVVRFNLARPADKRTDLAARLVDPAGAEQLLLSIVRPEAEPDDDSSVWLSTVEWRTIVAAVLGLGRTMPALVAIGEKLGPGGNHVIKKGLKVRNPQEVAA